MNSSRRSSISSHSQSVTLIDQIDQWERQSLLLIKQAADRARQRVTDLLTSNTRKGTTVRDSHDFRRRSSMDTSISDLTRQIRDLNNCSLSIKLSLTPIDWSSIIRVFVESSSSSLDYEVSSPRQLFLGGSLLTPEDEHQLNRFYGNDNQKWHLVYKATRDGFTIDDFHRCCDSQGPTISVIQTLDRYLFGGCTSVSWNFHQGMNAGAVDRTAFLFTLANPHGIAPTKYLTKSSGENAVVPNAMGPTFGHYDFAVYPNSNLNSESFIKFPVCYIDTTGKGYLTFTASTNFTTTDIEVYRLANIWDQQF